MKSVETLGSPVTEKQAGAAVDVKEATKDLENIKHAHEFDPNLPQEKIDFLNKALQDGDADEIIAAETIFTDDSPYIEVRAAVRNTDGEEVANTVRAWILGMIFVTIGSGLNMFLSMRSPAINFPSLVVQLLVYPIGCLWAKIMPTRVFNLFGLKWTFNTGPFTIKEHVVIVLMSNTYVTAYLGDPLLAPVHTAISELVGLVVFVILATIGITYTGSIYSEYLPINTSQTYDNTQNSYNVSRILGDGFSFDLQKYKSYSPLFLSPAFALNYGLSFAALIAALVHCGLFHGKEIWYRLKSAKNQEPDIHMRLMAKYQDAPEWWYLALFVISLALGLATALGYDSQLPWWAFFVAIILAVVFMLPTTIILAISNLPLALNVLSPYLAGFMIPGKPIGVMIFKVYSTIVLGQAQTYAGDMKMAHYLKIPPRITFWCQVVATIWATFVQIAVMNWTLGNIDGACDLEQPAKFTCPNGRTFFSSSIVWGVIGPERMFGAGSIYQYFNVFWLIGAALPCIFYGFLKFGGRLSWVGRTLHAPIMLGAMGWLPPATPLSFWTWGLFALLFNHVIKKRYNGWWSTYNYVTAAGLDAGLVISTIVIFFAITFPGVTIPQWWGNVGVFENMDSTYTAILKTVPEGETFGPATWS
ncbi:hypothetical protein N0V82_007015 [Gnomoniopsis sp. IMI 355080]|nr:hypothetical protein N0V82_007015 [Gnomoniopsis sp. IMI 355080]